MLLYVLYVLRPDVCRPVLLSQSHNLSMYNMSVICIIQPNGCKTKEINTKNKRFDFMRASSKMVQSNRYFHLKYKSRKSQQSVPQSSCTPRGLVCKNTLNRYFPLCVWMTAVIHLGTDSTTLLMYLWLSASHSWMRPSASSRRFLGSDELHGSRHPTRAQWD